MSSKGKAKKKWRGEVFQEKSMRHGLSWCYDWQAPRLENGGRGKRYRKAGFKSKSQAETYLTHIKAKEDRKRLGLEAPPAPKQTTIGEAVEHYIKILTARWDAERGLQYKEKNKGQLNALRKWAEFTGREKLVSDLNKDDFTLWIQEASITLKPSSIKRRLNNVRAALRHAGETRNDLVNFRVPKMPKGLRDTKRARMLSDEEIRAIAGVLKARPPVSSVQHLQIDSWPDAYDLFLVALATGARLGELLALKWESVDFNHNTIYLFATKTNKERTLTVPAAVEVLRKRAKAARGGTEKVWMCKDHSIRDAFRSASGILKLPYGQQNPDKRAWTVHDLRHTCLSNLLISGADIITVRDWAGHFSVVQTEKYIHPSMIARQKAVEASSRLVEIAIGNGVAISSQRGAISVNNEDSVKLKKAKKAKKA